MSKFICKPGRWICWEHIHARTGIEKHQGEYSQREEEKPGMEALELSLGCWRERVILNTTWFLAIWLFHLATGQGAHWHPEACSVWMVVPWRAAVMMSGRMPVSIRSGAVRQEMVLLLKSGCGWVPKPRWTTSWGSRSHLFPLGYIILFTVAFFELILVPGMSRCPINIY